MPSLQPSHRSRQRRDPPSCHLCRMKKLKCDRQRPCSNCRTRRLACNYNGEMPIVTAPATAENGDSDLQAQNEALKARVSRLEKAVFGDSAPESAATETQVSRQHSTASSSQWLEGLGAYRTHEQFSDGLQVKIRTADQLALDAEHQVRTRDISLPTRDMVMACIDLFEAHLDASQAVLHLSSVRTMVCNIYLSRDTGRYLTPGSMALILAICASMGSWELSWEHLFTDPTTATCVSAFMAREAMRALESARISSQISIEAVQATIILTFHFCHLEGLSPHTRLLQATGVTMARELGLHRIDAPGSDRTNPTRAQIIEAEVGRKVWWHLACSDWLFAYNGGPTEGTYSVHPRHMAVKIPRNLNHEDLNTQGEDFERAENEPTAMAFHLQRIKVATICREVTDEMWDSPMIPDPEQIHYERVAALDTKFCNLIDNLPVFLGLDSTVDALSLGPDHTDRWQIVVQRATINLMIHPRRCKLHLPFLIYFKSDPRYELSRRICLESARKVFEVRSKFEAQKSGRGYKAFLQLGGQLSHIFYAAFVLVMDLCVNQDSNDPKQVAEVHDAIKVMEDAKTSSKIASTCYESLMGTLRKHQVNLPSTEFMRDNIRDEDPQLNVLQYQVASGMAMPEAPIDSSNTQVDVDQDMMNAGDAFEDVWQDYLYNGASLEPQSWEALINDLGMHIV